MVDGTFDGHGFGMVMVEVGQWGEVLMNLSRWFGLGGLVLWCMMRYCESIFLLEINWILGSNYMWACLWAFRLFQLVDGIWLFKKFVWTKRDDVLHAACWSKLTHHGFTYMPYKQNWVMTTSKHRLIIIIIIKKEQYIPIYILYYKVISNLYL